MKLFSVNAGYFKLDGGAMHGVVPKSMWQQANPADESNMCTWAMRCMLVEHGNYRILIDTGMGNKQDEKFFSHYHPHGDESLEKNLQKHGYSAEDITDVFLTHLHFDHCGGAVRKEGEELVPAFPKAMYWSTEKHWQAAASPNEREKASFLKENFMPLAERTGILRQVDIPDGEEWIQDIRVRFVNGHTDSMMLPQIKFNDRTILVTGRARTDARVVRVARPAFRRMIAAEPDIGEIVMRAFILRRVGLMLHGQAGVALIGPAHGAD
ncbi:MAG: MBL fold metallo-hydrolase, partial [Sphingobacteriales bacterium]